MRLIGVPGGQGQPREIDTRGLVSSRQPEETLQPQSALQRFWPVADRLIEPSPKLALADPAELGTLVDAAARMAGHPGHDASHPYVTFVTSRQAIPIECRDNVKLLVQRRLRHRLEPASGAIMRPDRAQRNVLIEQFAR